MAPKTVVTVGTSGNIGKAAIATFGSTAFADRFTVKAGVRDPSKGLGDLDSNTSLIKADLSKPETLKSAFQGADVVLIVSPGSMERTELVCSGLEAAKDANVPLVIFISVPTVTSNYGLFGHQFAPIEAKAKELGLPYCAVRLPIFTDNNWGNKGSIVGQGAIYSSQSADSKFVTITTADVGLALATIAYEGPAKHARKTYFLTCPPYSNTELAKAFSHALGKPVHYVQVPEENTKQALMRMGQPEWQVNGFLELLQGIDSGHVPELVTYSDDFEKLTGKKPTTIQEWTKAVAPGFAA